MRTVIVAILAALTLAACAREEGAVNKARVTPQQQLLQEQQRQQERDRVIQEQRQTLPPTR
jgi:hypothetical protein